MTIDWMALLTVAGVSMVFGVGLVAVFSIGVLGLSAREAARDGDGPVSGSTTGLLLCGAAFAICGAAVLYGLYLIIPQFH